MHLGNGAITTDCAVLGFGLATLGLSSIAWLTRRSEAPAAGKVASLGMLVFAAQLVNISVGSHSSAHLVGGVLLTQVLGANLAVRVMTCILLLQALLLGDGGLLALGINIVNMALVPALVATGCERWLGRSFSTTALAAALSTLLAALLIPGEVAWGRSLAELAQWQHFFVSMLAFHLPAATLEAALTLLALVAWERGASRSLVKTKLATGLSAVLLAISAGAISSALPDGYEAAAEQTMQFLLAGPAVLATSFPWGGELVSAVLATLLVGALGLMATEPKASTLVTTSSL